MGRHYGTVTKRLALSRFLSVASDAVRPRLRPLSSFTVASSHWRHPRMSSDPALVEGFLRFLTANIHRPAIQQGLAGLLSASAATPALDDMLRKVNRELELPAEVLPYWGEVAARLTTPSTRRRRSAQSLPSESRSSPVPFDSGLPASQSSGSLSNGSHPNSILPSDQPSDRTGGDLDSSHLAGPSSPNVSNSTSTTCASCRACGRGSKPSGGTPSKKRSKRRADDASYSTCNRNGQGAVGNKAYTRLRRLDDFPEDYEEQGNMDEEDEDEEDEDEERWQERSTRAAPAANIQSEVNNFIRCLCVGPASELNHTECTKWIATFRLFMTGSLWKEHQQIFENSDIVNISSQLQQEKSALPEHTVMSIAEQINRGKQLEMPLQFVTMILYLNLQDKVQRYSFPCSPSLW